jgi:cytoskeletal protein CcmA (bactofilin family)
MIFKKKEQHLEVIIGPESSITGTLSTRGVARIDGLVEGVIRADWLFVGEAATVKGTVFARGTMVAGRVEGSIKSEEIVEIKANATVEGDIHTPKLSIAEGAYFDGRSFMRRTPLLEGGEVLLLEKGGKKSLRSVSASDNLDDR